MVQGVEQIRPKNQARFISNYKGAPQRQVGLYEIEAAQGIPSEVALDWGNRDHQRRRIDPPPSGYTGIINPLGNFPHAIGPEIVAAKADVPVDGNVDWQPGLCGENSIQTPTSG